MNNPLVSVIIPTYKRKSIHKALSSVLDQDYPNIEIIIVDDNAEFPEYRRITVETLKSFGDYHNILLIQNDTNLGGALARNAGIAASSGEYVAFLDDDDWYLPGKISKQVEILNTTGAGTVYCWCRGETENGEVVWENTKNKEGNLLVEAMTECIANTSLIMCRRSVLDNVGMFDDMPCKQDVFLELKMAAAGYNFACVPETLVVYGNCESDFQRVSNISSKTIIGFKKVRDLARLHYDKLTRKQVAFVEGDTACKICSIAAKLKDKKTYSQELKIALRYQKKIKRLLRVLLDGLHLCFGGK